MQQRAKQTRCAMHWRPKVRPVFCLICCRFGLVRSICLGDWLPESLHTFGPLALCQTLRALLSLSFRYRFESNRLELKRHRFPPLLTHLQPFRILHQPATPPTSMVRVLSSNAKDVGRYCPPIQPRAMLLNVAPSRCPTPS